ncbi:hypothetical protein Metev_0671 [Methanohalobium evestigatum Z-7303]|uniref:Uncharacterized protein n=1 Tax=Methanohalobium evestigatum (strain ATCC BAA-1072 / DSM 3721 / NBRC 107634 / OCM 161 / Z-7303) TaxID=644295 RepID=D7E6V3_METEZ|nr:hypothetical protein [Methanohalobium evestigatum]ADI73577.1 hypothetical protein Metev_0671 [Methanohalobium evestigatum Z-7303]
MQKPINYITVLVEKTPEYELRFRIKKDYLEQNNIEFSHTSKVLNEIDDEYLMLDSHRQGVWIPKEIIECEKVMIDKKLDADGNTLK